MSLLFGRLELDRRIMKNTETKKDPTLAGPASNNEEPSTSDGQANNGLDSGRDRGACNFKVRLTCVYKD